MIFCFSVIGAKNMIKKPTSYGDKKRPVNKSSSTTGLSEQEQVYRNIVTIIHKWMECEFVS